MSKTLVERLQEIVYEHAGYGGSHDGKYERDDCIELAREIDKLQSANAELEAARDGLVSCKKRLMSDIAELEAKLENAERRSEYWKGEHLVANKLIEAGLELADEMERRNYSGTMDWYAEQLREALGGSDEGK